MPNLQWPSDICPMAFSLVNDANVRGFSGVASSSEGDVDLNEDRWLASLSVDAVQGRQAAKLAVLTNRLAGGFSTVELYHFARPLPRGTARVSRGLSAPAAKGAAEVTLLVEPLATLLVGDMVKVGNLLLQVAEDCYADASGVIVVPLVNRLRNALIGHTRASTASYVDSAGVLQTAAVDTLRSQYAEYVTNLVYYSQDLTNAAWAKNNVAVTANHSVAGQLGVFLVTSGNLGNDFITQPIRLSLGMQATTTWRVYKGTSDAFNLMRRTATETSTVGFNWTGSVLSVASGVPADTTVTLTALGSGWYDVSVTRPLGEPQQGCRLYPDNLSAGGSLYVKHVQFEFGAVAHAHIQTLGTAVTAGQGSAQVLVEPAATNLMRNSEQMQLSPWTAAGTTITVNATTGPDGLSSAEKLVENTNNSTHYLNGRTALLAANTRYVVSWHVKADSDRKLTLRFLAGGAYSTNRWVYFDLLTGLFSSPQGADTTYGAFQLANGWWRVWVSAISDIAGTQDTGLFLVSGGSNTYTGDGVTGHFMFGGQVEVGEVPTSYIPTTTVEVTRAADNLSTVIFDKPSIPFRMLSSSPNSYGLTALNSKSYTFEEDVS